MGGGRSEPLPIGNINAVAQSWHTTRSSLPLRSQRPLGGVSCLRRSGSLAETCSLALLTSMLRTDGIVRSCGMNHLPVEAARWEAVAIETSARRLWLSFTQDARGEK